MALLAFLPMYDVPGTRPFGDRLWGAFSNAIRRCGIDAPADLDRSLTRAQGWTDPALVLGQTCGLPYMQSLCDKVQLVGTPDYRVEGCPPGFYHSTLVVAAADTRRDLAAFRGGTLALNGTDSQSGYGAIMRAVAPLARDGRFFGRAVKTGSHAASMRLVADGGADIAAIDSVTWRISRRFDPVAAGVKAIMTTEPTPGLPFIAAAGQPAERLFHAVHSAIASLDEDVRDVFGLHNLIPLRHNDYAVILDQLKAAEAVHALPPLVSDRTKARNA